MIPDNNEIRCETSTLCNYNCSICPREKLTRPKMQMSFYVYVKLLDKIMAAIGLSTNDDMLIANIVKCRPPKNRVPSAEEAATCMPHLLK